MQFGPAKAARIARHYPLSRFNGSASAAFTAADSDHCCTCPSRRIARAVAGAPNGRTAVYTYLFARTQRQCDLGYHIGDVPAGLVGSWASHGAELVFVFGNERFADPLGGQPLQCRLTPDEQALSASMQVRRGRSRVVCACG